MPETFVEQALVAVRARVHRSSKLSAGHPTPFLDGTLVAVVCTDSKDEEETQLVFFYENTFKVMEFPDEVAEIVKDRTRYSFIHRIIYSLLNIGGISGLIAIILVLAMIFMMFSRIPIDENAWKIFTLVIGFYFGNVTGKR